MSVVDYQDLPLADRNRDWDGTDANKRLRDWAGAQDEPNERYRRAFVWYDADDKDKFKGYKFQIADVVGGKLKAVPRGIFQAAAVMQGARGGADIPKKDIGAIKSHLQKYYDKMEEVPPWEEG